MALDVVCLVVPFATGSAALKASVKAANAIDNVLDAGKAAKRVGDVAQTVKAADKFVDGAKWADEAIDLMKAGDNIMDAKKAVNASAKVGSYDILFSSGKRYVGKGGQARAFTSALSRNADDAVVAIKWKPAVTQTQSFMDEANRMAFHTQDWTVHMKNGQNFLYNKIWSPGKKLLGF